jgi:transposase InsO family protein
MSRLDEPGERPLVQTVEPVNRYPDFVRNLVRQLKALHPTMGVARIADILGRLGLRLAPTTIGRILREKAKPSPVPPAEAAKRRRRVVAKYPGHTWHVDLSTVPIRAGLWVPWLPQSLAQRWPFSWCVAVIVDQVSRACLGFAAFHAPPTSRQIQQFLERAIGARRHVPRYVLTDRGTQFDCRSFKRWCKRRGIRARYGVLGEPSSICIVERFIRSLKDECTRRIQAPELAGALHQSTFTDCQNAEPGWPAEFWMLTSTSPRSRKALSRFGFTTMAFRISTLEYPPAFAV